MTWETFLVLTDDNIVSPNTFFLHLILFYTQKKKSNAFNVLYDIRSESEKNGHLVTISSEYSMYA